MTPEIRAEVIRLLKQAHQQCDDILDTCQLLKKDLMRHEAEQSIPFELHYGSAMIQSGISNQLN